MSPQDGGRLGGRKGGGEEEALGEMTTRTSLVLYRFFFRSQGFLIISFIASSAVPHAPSPSARHASLSVASGTIRPDTIVLPARL